MTNTTLWLQMGAHLPMVLDSATTIYFDAHRHVGNPLMSGIAGLAAAGSQRSTPFAVAAPRFKPLQSLVHHLRCLAKPGCMPLPMPMISLAEAGSMSKRWPSTCAAELLGYDACLKPLQSGCPCASYRAPGQAIWQPEQQMLYTLSACLQVAAGISCSAPLALHRLAQAACVQVAKEPWGGGPDGPVGGCCSAGHPGLHARLPPRHP